MKYYQPKVKNIAEQVAMIKRTHGTFNISYDHQSLVAKGDLQPTARSCSYSVRIQYTLNKQPQIDVLEPKLVKNFNGDDIPHTYTGNKLCLHRPKYREFKFSDYLSNTIIPWISLWLYYYEMWHVTGDWLGGGEHPK